MTTWVPDVLGDGYEQTTLVLGPDPDGEGIAEATLVRYRPSTASSSDAQKTAVVYVHGFTDYFFQTHVAEHFADQGYAFYALDLRKCGRSFRPGQTPHFISDLEMYDDELGESLRIVRSEHERVLLMGHSTGGLIVPLWLARLNRTPGGTAGTGIRGVILNSPWFDLQGPPLLRSVGTSAISLFGRIYPKGSVPSGGIDTYGLSLSSTADGEWDYNLDWKPLAGFPITFGWIRAVRIGHATLHRGLDIGAPSLIMRSKVTKFSRHYIPEVDMADAVLDVTQIARWAGCLGDRTTVVPIEGARHDIFLSRTTPLERAFTELDSWLSWLRSTDTADHPTGQGHIDMETTA